MKPSFVDTDILSQFLRNNLTVVSNANKYLKILDFKFTKLKS